MDSLARIGNLVETARDLTLEAASGAASRKTSSKPVPTQAIKKLLDSRKDADILEGLRHVIGLFYANKPVLQYFTAVVKNTASSNLEIKRLVYALLIQLAETAPDTALLSINSIQRGLSDSDPKMRALALRTMSAIRVPVISQIVALGIKRGVGDMNPLVRKTAALAIVKCHRLDPATEPLLIEHVATLLGDRQYYVAGAAVTAFLEICPDRLDLIHPHYRGLIKKLVDMDEWGQLATLRMLLTYARQCFPKSDQANLETLLQAAQPLLQSRSAAVIIAVARLNLYLGSGISTVVGPVMSILRTSTDTKSLALDTIVEMCYSHPTAFVPYATEFLLSVNDSPSIVQGKLSMQSLLFSHISPAIRSLLLTDLTQCITSTSTDSSTLQLALLTLGTCAATAPTSTLRAQCLHLLFEQLSSPDQNLVGAALDEIRLLVQRNPKLLAKTVIVRLAKHLDGLTSPKARAAIIWLVGEYVAAKGTVEIAADVWRILLHNFADEDEMVQSQILLLAAKVYLHHQQDVKDLPDQDDDPIGKRLADMLTHTFLLARYSTSFPLRDRARYLRALILDSPSIALGTLLLLSSKPEPETSANFGSKTGIQDGRYLSNLSTSAGRLRKSSSGNLGSLGDGTRLGDSINSTRSPLGYSSRILKVNVPSSPSIPAWTTVEVGSLARNAANNTSSSVVSVSSASTSRISTSKSVPTSSIPANASKSLEEWLEEEEVNDKDEFNTLGAAGHNVNQNVRQAGNGQIQGHISVNQGSIPVQAQVSIDSDSVEESDETESSGYESTTDESTDEEESE